MRFSYLLTALCLTVSFVSLLAWADDLRPYADGPLSADDFRLTPKEVPAGKVAMAATELLYDYKYRYRSNHRTTTITLTELDIKAMIRRGKSWNLDPKNAVLLDHEQGHADNAQIQALKARIALAERQKRKPLTASGANLESAIGGLRGEIGEFMRPFEEALRAADIEYDRATSHGLGPKQAEWRRVQQEMIKRLEEELAAGQK